MITKKLYRVPIYPNKLEIVIYDDVNEIQNYRPDRKGFIAFCDKFPDGFIRIGICSNSKISIVAHEAEHAKNAIWRHIGYSATEANDEVDAYLIEWIVSKTSTLLNKHNNNKNVKDK